MTTIRDPLVPKVEGEVRKDEFRKLDKVMTGRRLVVLLGVSALVLTAANLVASTYLLGTVREFRALDAKLEDMAGLEKRIKASLDVVNTGFQAKLDDLDRSIYDQITVLEDGVGQIHRRLDQQAVGAAALPEPAQAPEPTIVAAPPSGPAAEESVPGEADAAGPVADSDLPVASTERPKPRKPAPRPVSKVGSAYERIATPDGKVYYRRIH